jgi:2-(1,2-epoxy-1,2-dihydrophenyl)acetyl-CoA isomerase
MADQILLYDVADGVATITLNRPERLNAFSPDLVAALSDALKKVEDDPAVRCGLITGAGRGFCAGADLAARNPQANPSADSGAVLEKLYNPMIVRMRSMPKPLVAAVNGVAAGAGMSVALACDIAIAAKSASFLQAFARIGLVPDAGSTWLLPRLAGDARARALAMLAPQISAEQALAWGLIWQVVDDDKLMGEAGALARKLASGPTRSYAAIKKSFAVSGANTLVEQLALERDLQRELGASEDFREGVAAFLAKRPAAFKGR